ncbi:hypothetical protein [Amycolatopsis sp. cmx-11-51]|uniref:hypothetical protein n=1 Tax=Amycolatopsis sp. cmx-11-51 TaxID=2785797 RepID=UPI0039E42D7C
MLDVPDHRQGDSRILEAIVLMGAHFDGENSTHLLFKPVGTEMAFEEDVLEMSMVRTRPDDTYGWYPRPAALVKGLSPTATRAEVIALLGDPERVGPPFGRYEVNKHCAHFEFDSHDRVARISALLEAL